MDTDMESKKMVWPQESRMYQKTNFRLMIDPAKLVWRIIKFFTLCINPSVRSRHGKQSWAIHIFMFSTRRRSSTKQCHWHSTCRYLAALIVKLYIVFSSAFPQFPQFLSFPIQKWNEALSFPRYAVHPSEGSSVKVNAEFLKESHPGSCLLRWYPPRWVIVILWLWLIHIYTD